MRLASHLQGCSSVPTCRRSLSSWALCQCPLVRHNWRSELRIEARTTGCEHNPVAFLDSISCSCVLSTWCTSPNRNQVPAGTYPTVAHRMQTRIVSEHVQRCIVKGNDARGRASRLLPRADRGAGWTRLPESAAKHSTHWPLPAAHAPTTNLKGLLGPGWPRWP